MLIKLLIRIIFFNLIFLSISCSSYSRTIIAHRGASGYLPEHTLEGVAMAHAFNVHYIEPDLVLTKDNKLIVLHDKLLDKTTNVALIFPMRKRQDGHYYAIDFLYSEIQRLNVHERLGNISNKVKYKKRYPLEKNSHFKIPLFSEYVRLVKGLNKSRNRKTGIIPEIKSPEFHLKEGKDIFEIFHREIVRLGLNKNDGFMYLQCFHAESLKKYKNQFRPKVPLIQLLAENSWNESTSDYEYLKTSSGMSYIQSYAIGVAPWLGHIVSKKGKSKGLVERARRHDLMVFTYTLRKDDLYLPKLSYKEHLDLLFNIIKVDGVFTDHPDLAMSN